MINARRMPAHRAKPVTRPPRTRRSVVDRRRAYETGEGGQGSSVLDRAGIAKPRRRRLVLRRRDVDACDAGGSHDEPDRCHTAGPLVANSPHPLMTFRIGHPTTTVLRSPRRPAEEVVLG